MLRMTLIAVCATLAACSPKAAAPKADEKAAETAQPASSGPVTDEAEASAETAWIELIGAWAPKDACADVTRQWIVEANAFHLFEMHCAVKSIELAGSGVKAIAACSVEGDDDGVDDAFTFARQKDATLTIMQEANGATTAGLLPCSEDIIP